MNINELWELDPLEFNDWRRKNDLLALFENFKLTLPLFEQWLIENLLTIEKILSTDQPGKFFYYEKEVCVVNSPAPGLLPYCFYEISSSKDKKMLLSSAKDSFSFIPYLIWVKKKLKKQKIIPTRFSGDLETFRYTQYTPQNAILCTGFAVLKMGNIGIDGWANFILRNLDFCDLDFLTINAGLELSRKTEVFFATFRNLTLLNSEGNFKYFYQCHFENLNCDKSKLYGFEFVDSELYGVNVRNSRLSDFMFVKSYLSLLNFETTTVSNVFYFPPLKPWGSGLEHHYESISNNFKDFRVVFQSNGLRKDASEAYYKERVYEMKFLSKNHKIWKAITDFEFKYTLLSIKNIWTNFKQLFKHFSSVFSYYIWGFGERPGRIATSSLIVILSFATYYFFCDIAKTHGDYVNSLYLSVVTFTTLGFGDINPADSTSITKLIVSCEALLGAFCIGLFVAGFSNKSRY